MSSEMFPKLVSAWHNEAGIPLDPASLEPRTKTIEALAATDNKQQTCGLARLAFGHESEEATNQVLDVACSNEPAFLRRGNDNLVSLIAAAALVARIEAGDWEPRLTASSLVQCALAAGLGSPIAGDLSTVSADRLGRSSTEERAPRAIAAAEPLATYDTEGRGRLLHKEGVANPVADHKEVASLLVAELDLLRAAVRVGTRKTQSLETALAHRIKVDDERSAILWWVVSEESLIADRSWSNLPANSRPLVSALELCRLSEFRTGPHAQKQFLRRFAGDLEDVSVKESRAALTSLRIPTPEVSELLLPFTPLWGFSAETSTDFSLGSVDLAERAHAELRLLGLVKTNG